MSRCPKCKSEDYVYAYKNKFSDKPSRQVCLKCDYEEKARAEEDY